MANSKKSEPDDKTLAPADPNELVDVVDAAGNRSRVGRSWLERWPDDFKLIDSADAPAPAADPVPAPGQENPDVNNKEKIS